MTNTYRYIQIKCLLYYAYVIMPPPPILGKHVAFASVGVSVGVQSLTSQYVKNYLSDGLQIWHTTPLGGLDLDVGVNVLRPTLGSVIWPN